MHHKTRVDVGTNILISFFPPLYQQFLHYINKLPGFIWLHIVCLIFYSFLSYQDNPEVYFHSSQAPYMVMY